MSGDTSCNYLALNVASNCLSSHTHRHVFVSRALVHVMRTISSRSVSLVVGGACAGRRVTATRELQHYTSLKQFFGLGCACSRHVASNMVGSASIDDGWSGQSDQSGKKNIRSSRVHICSHHLDTFSLHSCSHSFSRFRPKLCFVST